MYSSSQACMLITLEMHRFMPPLKAQDRGRSRIYQRGVLSLTVCVRICKPRPFLARLRVRGLVMRSKTSN